MRALVMSGPALGPERTALAEVPVPRPADGEVSIEVTHAGVNFLDVMARRGDPGYVPAWPYVAGLEVAGRVRETGPGVTGLVPGQAVAAFTRGLVRALEFTDQNREEAFELAKKEFPTFDPDVLKATLDRAYADGLWEFTGQITPESIDTALAVVRASGVLKDADDPVTYDEIVDMTFIEQVGSE